MNILNYLGISITEQESINSINKLKLNLSDNYKLDENILKESNQQNLELSTIHISTFLPNSLDLLTKGERFITPNTVLNYNGLLTEKTTKTLIELLNMYNLKSLQVESRFIQIANNENGWNNNIDLILKDDFPDLSLLPKQNIQVNKLIFLYPIEQDRLNYILDNVNANEYYFLNSYKPIELDLKYKDKYINIINPISYTNKYIVFKNCIYNSFIDFDCIDTNIFHTSNAHLILEKELLK